MEDYHPTTPAPDRRIALLIDDDGKVVLLQLEVPDAERTRVEEAARSCPVSALSVEG